MSRRVLFASSLVLCLTATAWPQEDPVLRARAQRAAAQGVADGDLPPVPRGIVEPPPLPPPEAHVKDLRKARRSKGRAKRGKTGARKSKGAAKASKSKAKEKKK